MHASRLRPYLELTKPGITLFIGIVGAAGFITAVGGFAMPLRFAVMLISGMLMSAGAAALNHVAEREWDGMMRRTASRPLPAGRIAPRNAKIFGWGLSCVALALSLAFLPRAASITLVLCHVSYVFVYTPMKRRTPLCTLAGAVPGALPVLAGWNATGLPMDVRAVALTGLLFMWQIPHFLAIGWMARDDYRAAGCPMLGVVEPSGEATARVSLVYAAGMLVCAAVLGFTSRAGIVYGVVAIAAAMAYVVYACRFVSDHSRAPARKLFFSSLVVLPATLLALVIDLVLVG